MGKLHDLGLDEAQRRLRCPPAACTSQGRKVWTASQLQTFLRHSRHDRFLALWVLEATSGMRRCELAGARRNLLDLDAGTLEIDPRVSW